MRMPLKVEMIAKPPETHLQAMSIAVGGVIFHFRMNSLVPKYFVSKNLKVRKKQVMYTADSKIVVE